MRALLTGIVLILLCYRQEAQPVHDRDFHMASLESCLPDDHNRQLFSKVEIDPILNSMSRDAFTSLLRDCVEAMQVEANSDGTVKLKLFFPVEGTACLRAVGLSGIDVDINKSINAFTRYLDDLGSHSPGLQRQTLVNCQGLVFIAIEEGQIGTIKIANFDFNEP